MKRIFFFNCVYNLGNGKHSKDKQHPIDNTLDDDSKRASSRGVIPKAKIKTVKMTLVIVLGETI